MSTTYAPIVLFTYNRPDHTRRTVEALAANPGARESDLFIYADGPKHEAVRPATELVRAYLKTISGFKSVTIIERDRNWGLADSIIDGVTSVINQYGTVIVLEDDIVTAPYFLQYMNDALTVYKSEHAVMHISGYSFPIDTTDLPDTYFYNQTSCWGWATWERAWTNLMTDVDELLQRATRVEIPKYEYNQIALSQLRANKRGQIKTWAARWQVSVSLMRGQCLHPRHSLTNNIGHDGSGVHSHPTNSFDNHLSDRPVPVLRQAQAEHPDALMRINRYLRSLRPPLHHRLIMRLKQLL